VRRKGIGKMLLLADMFASYADGREHTAEREGRQCCDGGMSRDTALLMSGVKSSLA